MVPKILVACIGNIFLGDDAFGVEVAHRFASSSLPDGVRVVDFGIRSYDLAYALMEDWDMVILADAVPRGGHPGTIYIIEPELPVTDAPQASALDAHTMDPGVVLQLVRTLGGEPKRMLVVGCEPTPGDPEDYGIELSAPVRLAVDEVVRLIEELIANFPAVPMAGSVRK